MHPYAKIWYADIKEKKQSCQTQIPGENINFDIEVKGHGHTGHKCARHIVPKSYTYMPNRA